jgi:hypothetical protein
MVQSSALFVAYYNKVETSLELIKSFLNKTSDKSLQEILLQLQFEEFDKIVNLHRKAEVKFILLSKL